MSIPPTTPAPRPAGLPPAPWILIDRTTVEQTAHLLSLLEQWLAGADPEATDSCARSCSAGEDDAFSVAAWVGTLAAHLHRRIDISDTDDTDDTTDTTDTTDGDGGDGGDGGDREIRSWP